MLTAEREFGLWCQPLTSFQLGRELDADGTQSLHEYVTWKADTAREVAAYCTQAGLERWHKSALMSYWSWAGHVARMPPDGMSSIAAIHTHRPHGRGRPTAHWNHIHQKLSSQ